MGNLTQKLPFIVTLMAIVGVTIGSLAFSQTLTVGAETDVGLETDVFLPHPVDAPIQQPVSTPAALPPAAPLDDADDGNDDGNDGAVAADANALPSAGSGGYLNSQPDSARIGYILAMLGVGLVLGFAAHNYSRSR